MDARLHGLSKPDIGIPDPGHPYTPAYSQDKADKVTEYFSQWTDTLMPVLADLFGMEMQPSERYRFRDKTLQQAIKSRQKGEAIPSWPQEDCEALDEIGGH